MIMNSQRERLMQHIKELYGTEPEHLWVKYPEDTVFRHPTSKKWYAVLLRVSRRKLGLEGDAAVNVLNIKCSPLMLGALLAETGFFPAYHMNKNNWISILLDESVADTQISSLLEFSYDSVAPKRKKRVQPCKTE